MDKKKKKTDINESLDDIDGITEKDSVKKPEGEKVYQVKFLHNRKFELKVNREILVWLPNGINPEFCLNEADPKNQVDKYRKGLPASIVNHKDFVTHKKYFFIK